MRPGVIDYTQIVQYLEIFLKLPHHGRTREDLLEGLLATPPKWLTKGLIAGHELDLAYIKQIETDQHLFDMTQCLRAIAESMLTVARSRCSELHCSMVHVNSSTVYPYNKDVAQPIRLVCLSLNATEISLRANEQVLRRITLQAGVHTRTKQAVASLGLLFQQDNTLAVNSIDLNGHLTTVNIVPHTHAERLADFSLGITGARSVFGLRMQPGTKLVPNTPNDPRWLVDRLPELADNLDRIARN